MVGQGKYRRGHFSSYFPPRNSKNSRPTNPRTSARSTPRSSATARWAMQRNVNQTPTVYVTAHGKTEALPGGGVDYKLLETAISTTCCANKSMATTAISVGNFAVRPAAWPRALLLVGRVALGLDFSVSRRTRSFISTAHGTLATTISSSPWPSIPTKYCPFPRCN